MFSQIRKYWGDRNRFRVSRIEFFPEEEPELRDCWAIFWFLPFTGAHLFYMREKKKGSFRLVLLILWLASPFLMKVTSIVWLHSWIYAGIIFPVIWVYDVFTLKKTFEARWGRRASIRI